MIDSLLHLEISWVKGKIRDIFLLWQQTLGGQGSGVTPIIQATSNNSNNFNDLNNPKKPPTPPLQKSNAKVVQSVQGILNELNKTRAALSSIITFLKRCSKLNTENLTKVITSYVLTFYCEFLSTDGTDAENNVS